MHADPGNGHQGAQGAHVAIDASGAPVVIWTENQYHAYVKRWDGAAWSLLGDALFVGEAQSHELPVLGELQAVGPSLVVDGSGRPIVAFRSGFGSGGNANSGVFVSAWNGSAWDSVGANPLNVDQGQQDGDPSLALDSDGHLVVAFMEPDPTTGLERVFVEQCR